MSAWGHSEVFSFFGVAQKRIITCMRKSIYVVFVVCVCVCVVCVCVLAGCFVVPCT